MLTSKLHAPVFTVTKGCERIQSTMGPDKWLYRLKPLGKFSLTGHHGNSNCSRILNLISMLQKKINVPLSAVASLSVATKPLCSQESNAIPSEKLLPVKMSPVWLLSELPPSPDTYKTFHSWCSNRDFSYLFVGPRDISLALTSL